MVVRGLGVPPTPSRTPMTPALATRTPALAVLFARYLAGQVAETQLNAVADLLEEADADAEERAAFTRFYLDALAAGEGDQALPKADELADLLAIARA